MIFCGRDINSLPTIPHQATMTDFEDRSEPTHNITGEAVHNRNVTAAFRTQQLENSTQSKRIHKSVRTQHLFQQSKHKTSPTPLLIASAGIVERVARRCVS